jgi:hypothetical protein
MRGPRVPATEASDRPTDFDTGFDGPKPDQTENWGANQDIQNREEVRVSSWWLDGKFQEMKGDARNRDNLHHQGQSLNKSRSGCYRNTH